MKRILIFILKHMDAITYYRICKRLDIPVDSISELMKVR